VLTGSSFSGEAIRVNTNRNYLARAMRLGLWELNITSDKTALACFDEHRQYVWMPLDPESSIPPATDAIRIESAGTEPQPPAIQPETRKRVSPVSEPVTSSSGSAASNGKGQANGRPAARREPRATALPTAARPKSRRTTMALATGPEPTATAIASARSS
jgi:hypothetical protein